MQSKRVLFLSVVIIGIIAGICAFNKEYGVAGTLAGLIGAIARDMFKND